MREKKRPDCVTLRRIAVLHGNCNGSFTKELRLVQWKGNAPTYDLRLWSVVNGTRKPTLCGITLERDELCKLRDILKSIDL